MGITMTEYNEYISNIHKIEDLFLATNKENAIEDIDDDQQQYQRFEKKIFGYISSILNNQHALLARNRALFLAINLGILGLLTTIIYEFSIYKYPIDKIPDYIKFNTAIYTVILALIGFGCSYLWKTTIYYRRHKVWFLESLLIYLEQGNILDSKAGGPFNIINLIDDKDKIRILNHEYSISSNVIKCEAKKAFTLLWFGFQCIYTLVFLCSLIVITDLALFNCQIG